MEPVELAPESVAPPREHVTRLKLSPFGYVALGIGIGMGVGIGVAVALAKVGQEYRDVTPRGASIVEEDEPPAASIVEEDEPPAASIIEQL